MGKAAASKKKLTPEEAKLKRQANDPIFLAKQREKLAAAATKQATATGNAVVLQRCLSGGPCCPAAAAHTAAH